MPQRTLTWEPNQYKARLTDLFVYRKEILLKYTVSTLTVFLYKVLNTSFLRTVTDTCCISMYRQYTFLITITATLV